MTPRVPRRYSGTLASERTKRISPGGASTRSPRARHPCAVGSPRRTPTSCDAHKYARALGLQADELEVDAGRTTRRTARSAIATCSTASRNYPVDQRRRARVDCRPWPASATSSGCHAHDRRRARRRVKAQRGSECGGHAWERSTVGTGRCTATDKPPSLGTGRRVDDAEHGAMVPRRWRFPPSITDASRAS